MTANSFLKLILSPSICIALVISSIIMAASSKQNTNLFSSDNTLTARNYATVSFEDVNRVKYDPGYLLIDVREPSELLETGSIPGFINIPLGDVEKALTTLSPAEFKQKYDRDKPSKDFKIFFSCRSGKRAGTAREKAIALGYTNVSIYSGSWLDWEKRTKEGNN